MPAISAYAPGKIILFGEHAVVYGRPAIAVPVEQVKAHAIVTAEPRNPVGSIHIQALDINLDTWLTNLPADHPLALALHSVIEALGVQQPPAFTLRIKSSIPLAAGLGSGASVTIAIMRAVAAFLGFSLTDEQVSTLAYEVEKLHHGTPSGIDNTVIAYRMPVYYVRNKTLQTLHVAQPFTIVIGNSGITSPTALTVGDLRERWLADQAYYEDLFDQVGQVVQRARQFIEDGETQELGALMDQNHALLQSMQISSPELDHLVQAARAGGALGAKLSGGGRGGNMIALVSSATAAHVAQALEQAGAVQTWITTIRPSHQNRQ